MTVLNYSTFLNLIKDHYSYDIDKGYLAAELLTEITGIEFDTTTDATTLSRFWTGEREISSDITNKTSEPKNRKKCVSYFTNKIFPELSVDLFEDFKDKLTLLIRTDDTIAESKKNNLLSYSVGEEGKWLGIVFLYAIKKPNKGPVTRLDIDDATLFDQVDQICPLCNQPLVKKYGIQRIYRFSISYIYPLALKPEKVESFEALHRKPDNLTDIVNKICMCDLCASNYLYRQDIETYDKLYRFKLRTLRHFDIKNATSDTSLDSKIEHILSNIKETDIDEDSFIKLRMKPLKVTKKIYPDNRTLIKSINDDNEVYFNFIKEKLSQLETYKLSFRKVASQVKTCFLSMLERTTDQEEIYYSLVQWVLDSQSLSENYRTAAQIIISFFVQNCEVFDEITE